MRRSLDATSLVLALGLIAFSIWAWPFLPDLIPTHFGIDGRPDAWDDRSLVSWSLLPALGVLLAVLMLGVRALLHRKPHWVNFPSGTKLVDLPESARPPILEELHGFLSLVQVQILTIFGLIQIATFRSATGGESRWIMIAVLLLAVLTGPLLLGVFFLRLKPAMDRAMDPAKRGATG